MNYEKAYKEVLERASKYYNANTNKGYREIFEDIFHEFKESEDERIRKGIICGMNALKEQHKETFASIPINDCIAWLEKQNEIKTEDFGEFINKLSKQFPEVSFAKLSRIAVRVKNWLEKQGEQKYTEKQDYSGLNDFERAIHRGFLCAGMENVPVTIIKETAKDCINEIKSLETGCEQKPVEQDTEIHDLWVYIREWNDKFGRLPKDEDELASCIDYVMKRQKQLSWSEKHIADVFEKVGLAKIVREGNDQLNNAVQSAMIELSKHQNPAWSEEDEEMYKEVLTDIIYAKNDLKTKGCLELSNRAMKAFNWFSKRHKSLRPQSKWKPSEEQLTALKNAIIGKRGPLYDLYFDLEKL